KNRINIRAPADIAAEGEWSSMGAPHEYRAGRSLLRARRAVRAPQRPGKSQAAETRPSRARGVDAYRCEERIDMASSKAAANSMEPGFFTFASIMDSSFSSSPAAVRLCTTGFRS